MKGSPFCLWATPLPQGQLAFAAVPGASNYSLLFSSDFATSTSQTRAFRAVVDDAPPAIGVNDNDRLITLAQFNPLDNRPTRIAYQATAAADGTVPAPATAGPKHADDVSIKAPAEKSDQASVKPARRVYLGAGLTDSGWSNAMRRLRPTSQTASLIPPPAPVAEP